MQKNNPILAHYKLAIFLFIISLLKRSKAIQLIQTVSAGEGFTFKSIDAQPNCIMSIAYNSTHVKASMALFQNSAYVPKNDIIPLAYIYISSEPTSFKIRAFHNNSNQAGKKGLYFDKEKVFEVINITYNYYTTKAISGNSTANIFNVYTVYGTLSQNVYVLTVNNWSGRYNLLHYDDNPIIGNITLPITNTYAFDKMFQNSLYVFILFSAKLYILSANATLDILYTYNFANTSIHQLDMNFVTDQATLIISINNTVKFYNISSNDPYSPVLQFQIDENVTSIKYFSERYILVSTQRRMIQYDLMNFVEIQSFLYPIEADYELNVISMVNVVAFVRNGNSQAYYILTFYSGYIMNCPPKKGINYYFPNLNYQMLSNITNMVALSMPFMSLKISPSFLFIMISFVEDLWFYKYHRLSRPLLYPQYPTTINLFVQQADFMGYIKTAPNFIQLISFFNDSNIGSEQNSQLMTYLNLTKASDIDELYFLHSTESTYKTNFILNIVLYSALKFIHFLLYKAQKKVKILKYIYLYIKEQTIWWTLITIIVQSNLSKLMYGSSLQLLMPSSMDFFDKINFICAVKMSFGLLLYVLCFYLLAYSSYKQAASKILLIKLRYGPSSFFFQCLLTFGRAFIRAFIHGYFILHHGAQIALLTMTDLFSVALILKVRQIFRFKIIFLLTLLYNATFLAFDIYFLLQQNFPTVKLVERELFGLVVACIILIITILISLFYLLHAGYQIFSLIYQKCTQKQLPKNKITDIFPSRSKSPTHSQINKDNSKEYNKIQYLIDNLTNINGKKYANQTQYSLPRSILKNKVKKCKNEDHFRISLQLNQKVQQKTEKFSKFKAKEKKNTKLKKVVMKISNFAD